jgi:hypothetical protein
MVRRKCNRETLYAGRTNEHNGMVTNIITRKQRSKNEQVTYRYKQRTNNAGNGNVEWDVPVTGNSNGAE